jgi:hypothetical protein
MRQEQLDSLYRWFQSYVGGFSSDNARVQAHLKLKQQHTYRVCAEMRHLVQSLALPDRDARIAEAIALLHDTGRFEQFVRYQTFLDARSENHCLLGLRILTEQKVLDALDENERRIIEKAIEFHGAMELPDLPADTLLFARLIRDADKIDIFDVIIKNYKEYRSKPEGFVLEVAFLDTPGCSPKVAQAVLARRPIDYRDLTTIDDAKLMQLGADPRPRLSGRAGPPAARHPRNGPPDRIRHGLCRAGHPTDQTRSILTDRPRCRTLPTR